MRFVVATYGTEGDTRPLAVLCRALIDAGHEATLLADRSTLGAATALGVPSVALAGDIKGVMTPSVGISNVVAGERGFSNMANALAHIANTHAEAWLREIVTTGGGCDAVIVSGLAAFVGLSAAEALGVKAIGTGLIPITPTSEFASPFLPQGIPRFLHAASQRLVNQMLWRAFRKQTNAARAAVCALPPRQSLWTDHPMLYGISPTLVPQPRDWPANAHVCGQWVAPCGEWTAPAALAEFLAAGEAPIYIGFGSMAGFDQKALLAEVVAAVGGRRALFYPGWSGADTSDTSDTSATSDRSATSALPANFHVIGNTPHDWLFPRTSVVIHHGGSGTSHSATRAGVPSVVVPFAGDQPFWADRLRRAGVAARAVPGRKLKAFALAKQIEFAERPATRALARELGERMRAETGVRRAVALIHELMRA
ncbi:glycosyltransferase family 1 protein [Pandoraea nosoerga]|uniref:Glycosyl transferase n=1 Tax=Pandoraea nosoerga TaxID=2508296 RepID=A0A5E4STR9_9BURK|nr:glycosyltransferase [Pandoraea nosoerga]MBN4665194.1 glycosyltransferase family 1 protein [Pandoraea nosoerga]MBN4674595.1 glycosyltransferase family 1 protein [Pandoraea nosoerga]MBN4680483.1 glycosyltransferase family 1 protein [Pandoraea nosoerga]MBN4743888.1 glycosyltransferase family 1 protein [Pandoraea nosoerga]VVD77229.1 glycosyl transferase [Pandoraea nosoerga]